MILPAIHAHLADALAVAPEDSASESVPIWLLRDSEMASWRATQTAAVAAWLDTHEFRGERHRVLRLPVIWRLAQNPARDPHPLRRRSDSPSDSC